LSVLQAHTGAITSIDVSAGGDLALTAGDDGKVKIWSLRQRALARPLEDLRDPVRSATFSPDGRKVAASATKSGIRVWDLERKSTLAHLPDQQPYSNLVFSPDSNRLAWGSGGRQLAWVGIRTPGQVSTLDAPGASNGGIGFLSDGSWLVSVGADRSLVLWDLDKRRIEYEFKEHHEGTLPLTVAHNRTQVLSNGAYGQHLFWDFLRTHEYLESEVKRIQAFATAAKNRADPGALRSVAIYYAFAGRCDWAVDLFDRAAAADSNIDASEDLARCYFLTNHRDKALRQFESLKGRDAVPNYYANLWIAFLSAH
jgi:WD40 repeat protein